MSDLCECVNCLCVCGVELKFGRGVVEGALDNTLTGLRPAQHLAWLKPTATMQAAQSVRQHHIAHGSHTGSVCLHFCSFVGAVLGTLCDLLIVKLP